MPLLLWRVHRYLLFYDPSKSVLHSMDQSVCILQLTQPITGEGLSPPYTWNFVNWLHINVKMIPVAQQVKGQGKFWLSCLWGHQYFTNTSFSGVNPGIFVRGEWILPKNFDKQKKKKKRKASTQDPTSDKSQEGIPLPKNFDKQKKKKKKESIHTRPYLLQISGGGGIPVSPSESAHVFITANTVMPAHAYAVKMRAGLQIHIFNSTLRMQWG